MTPESVYGTTLTSLFITILQSLGEPVFVDENNFDVAYVRRLNTLFLSELVIAVLRGLRAKD